MRLLQSLLGRRRQSTRSQSATSQPVPPPEAEAYDAIGDATEVDVPEITVAALRQTLADAAQSGTVPPLLLDVREPYEWTQVHLADSLPAQHMPMNDVPDRLADLPRERDIVVLCAHGGRSYGVAAYLIEQGYAARSLDGGITQWAAQGGEVEVRRRA